MAASASHESPCSGSASLQAEIQFLLSEDDEALGMSMAASQWMVTEAAAPGPMEAAPALAWEHPTGPALGLPNGEFGGTMLLEETASLPWLPPSPSWMEGNIQGSVQGSMQCSMQCSMQGSREASSWMVETGQPPAPCALDAALLLDDADWLPCSSSSAWPALPGAGAQEGIPGYPKAEEVWPLGNQADASPVLDGGPWEPLYPDQQLPAAHEAEQKPELQQQQQQQQWPEGPPSVNHDSRGECESPGSQHPDGAGPGLRREDLGRQGSSSQGMAGDPYPGQKCLPSLEERTLPSPSVHMPLTATLASLLELQGAGVIQGQRGTEGSSGVAPGAAVSGVGVGPRLVSVPWAEALRPASEIHPKGSADTQGKRRRRRRRRKDGSRGEGAEEAAAAAANAEREQQSQRMYREPLVPRCNLESKPADLAARLAALVGRQEAPCPMHAENTGVAGAVDARSLHSAAALSDCHSSGAQSSGSRAISSSPGRVGSPGEEGPAEAGTLELGPWPWLQQQGQGQHEQHERAVFSPGVSKAAAAAAGGLPEGAVDADGEWRLGSALPSPALWEVAGEAGRPWGGQSSLRLTPVDEACGTAADEGGATLKRPGTAGDGMSSELASRAGEGGAIERRRKTSLEQFMPTASQPCQWSFDLSGLERTTGLPWLAPYEPRRPESRSQLAGAASLALAGPTSGRGASQGLVAAGDEAGSCSTRSWAVPSRVLEVMSVPDRALRERLLTLAEAVAAGDRATQDALLPVVSGACSPRGSPVQRVVFYFLEALKRRMQGDTISLSMRAIMPDPETLQTKRFSKVVAFMERVPFRPFFLESLASYSLDMAAAAGQKVVHLVDFGPWMGGWRLFFHRLGLARGTLLPGSTPFAELPWEWELAKRFKLDGDLSPPWPKADGEAGHDLRSSWPVLIRVTAVMIPWGSPRGTGPPATLRALKEELELLAGQAGVGLEFAGVELPTSLADFRPGMVQCCPGETLILNTNTHIEALPDSSVLRSNPRDSFLKMLASMNPAAILVSNFEFELNLPFFLRRFNNALTMSLVLFSTFDQSSSRASEPRYTFESSVLSKLIMNLVACEGSFVHMRGETLRSTHKRMASLGLRPVPLSALGLDRLRHLLSTYSPGYEIRTKKGCPTLSWGGIGMVGASAWIPRLDNYDGSDSD